MKIVNIPKRRLFSHHTFLISLGYAKYSCVKLASVRSACTSVPPVTPRTVLPSSDPCGTSSPPPHSSALSTRHFGCPSTVLLSFPNSLVRRFFRPLGSLAFSLLSATKLHFSSAFSFILSSELIAACGKTGGYIWAWKKPPFPCRKAGSSSRAICDFQGQFKGRRKTVCPHFLMFHRIKAHPLE